MYMTLGRNLQDSFAELSIYILASNGKELF
jgi:hypothetical protein